MGSDDYTAAPIGGSLKLKGVKDAGISKHKKKRKRPKPENEPESETKAGGKSAGEQNITDVERASEENILEVEASGGEGKERLEDGTPGQGKTEAERRHEEAKRKRVSAHFFVWPHGEEY